jgi:hypothetical protein
VQLYLVPGVAVAASGGPTGVKVLSTWPTQPLFRLALKWVYGKKHFQLSSGTYRWYVWPGYGARADAKYGALLGDSTFSVKKKTKK